MTSDIRKVIAAYFDKHDPHPDLDAEAANLVSHLHAAGYTIAPLPEALTKEQIGAALDADLRMTERVQRREIPLGDAWRETYRAALEADHSAGVRLKNDYAP